MYGKLFASLYQGTLRGRANEILVFTNLIAHADRDGFVDKHFNAIAQEVGLTRAEVEAAIKVLESPDTESRSRELDGARLERIDEHRNWGWRIVNYSKYRAIRNAEERREQNRVAQAAYRNRSKQNQPRSAQAVASPSPSSSPCLSEGGTGEEVAPIAKFAEAPSWDEWWAYCQTIGYGAEWHSRNKWNVASANNWSKQQNWRHYAAMCRDWWRQDGGHMEPPQKTAGPEKANGAEIIVRQKEMDDVNQKIASILNSYEPHMTLSKDDVKKLLPLRQRRDELKKILGYKV